MKSLLFKIVFGTDEIATYMYNLLTLRKAAVKQHAENKDHQQRLDEGEGKLVSLKHQYFSNKSALENAYELNLS